MNFVTSQPRPSTLQSRNRKFRLWYESIVDWIIANPGGTLTQCAEFHKKTLTTISLITSSDAFRARLGQRRAEHAQNLSHSIVEKTTRVADEALSVVLGRIRSNPEKIPTSLMVEISDKALARLGYGASAPLTQTAVNVSLTVGAGVLEEARAKLRATEQGKLLEHEERVAPPRLLTAETRPTPFDDRPFASESPSRPALALTEIPG